MPFYDLVCKKCGNQEDDYRCDMDEEVKCPQCGTVMTRLMSPITFKMTNSYKTKHLRKYGNSNEVVPKSKDGGVNIYAEKRKR